MNVNNRLRKYLQKTPSLGEFCWTAPNAKLIGDVRIGSFSSVWYGCVLRADINFIDIGSYTNLQDGVIGHLSDDYPLLIGNHVTVGHGAVIHACEIEDECLIGMNSTVLDGAKIGKQSIIAAGTVVPAGMSVPEGSLVAGVPGEIKKQLSLVKREKIKDWSLKYVEVTKAHQNL